jgi:hypothetical protein
MHREARGPLRDIVVDHVDGRIPPVEYPLDLAEPFLGRHDRTRLVPGAERAGEDLAGFRHVEPALGLELAAQRDIREIAVIRQPVIVCGGDAFEMHSDIFAVVPVP